METSRNVFHLILIKPTHYDDRGYPIQWLRSAIPSNTLACIHGIAQDCRERHVLGNDVDIRITNIDETNRRVDAGRIMRTIDRDGGKALIALVGVQSNQFPRALDLARPFREHGLSVCIGGFHVSGCLSMLDGKHESLDEAKALGVSLFAGEAEDCRLDNVLQDAFRGTLKPIYNHMADLPDLTSQPAPHLPEQHVRRYVGSTTSVDLGRGCPFQCSFCTIINVQGRKSRFRTPEDLDAIIRENVAQNIHRFFITDDNFARNKNWEALFDTLISLREGEGIKLSFTIQVDTLCHKIPGFIEKARRAGVSRAFIGLENINPDSLLGAKKRQNRITDYRDMLYAWKMAGVITYAGYILGFPNDTRESIRRDIEIIKAELPIDILEFFVLTPLPGSEDHKVLFTKGVWMDPDLNSYDLNHVVTGHASMSKAEWADTYQSAWRWFYTPQHMATVMRRAAACGVSAGKIMMMMLWFLFAIRYADVHPLEAGYFRLRYRKDRRPSFKRENPILFYPRYLSEIIHNHFWMAFWIARMGVVRHRIRRDKAVKAYTDRSLTAPKGEEYDEFALFETRGGDQAVAKRQREDAARAALKADAVPAE